MAADSRQQELHISGQTAQARETAVHWAERLRWPAGTMLAVLLALLVTWHVINGKDGLSAWQKKRAEERQYQQEIDRLQKENAQLRDRIQHLQTDPDAIEHEAREELHYAKPGEVIYTLPAPLPPPQGQSTSPAK
ncbi:MAG TPA: septum formation initiator family protein [Terracidiphilus sp.]|nr:septum formation initiator family protein [Terracidiphilus sp.]